MADPQNNGIKIFTLLVQYSALTNEPTGVVKPNVPSDPDYIEPVEDLDACPVGGANTMNILVEIVGAVQSNFKLLFGSAVLSKVGAGVWNVPIRVYDSVVFEVISNTSTYTMEVFHSGGVRQEIGSGIGNTQLTGPFTGITKIKISSAPHGDFDNEDFNGSFDNI